MAIKKNIAVIDGNNQQIWLMDENGTVLKKIGLYEARDGLAYDSVSEKLWFNREDTGATPTNNFLYGLDKQLNSSGLDLTVNGLFAADTDWDKGAGWAIANGRLEGTTTTANTTPEVAILVLGQYYKISYEIDATGVTLAGDVSIDCGSGTSGTSRSTVGTYSETLLCAGSTVLIINPGTSFTGHIVGVKVQKVVDVLKINPASGTAFELEGVCHDPSDNTLWIINDEVDDPPDATLENRSISDGSVIGSVYNISTPITGPQGICYDTSDDTLWISCNDTDTIYNVTKNGKRIVANDIDITAIHSEISGDTSSQDMSYDDRDDTLWFSVASQNIYHITKTGTLIKRIVNPGHAGGPTGIELLPTWFLSRHTPKYSLRMYDDTAAITYLAAQEGESGLLVGETLSVVGTTGPINRAIHLDGGDNYVEFNMAGDASTFILPKLGYSFSIWINPDQVELNTILGDVMTTSANRDWFRLNADGSITIRADKNTSTLSLTTEFTALEWQHLVFCKTGSTTCDIWRNGEKVTDGGTVSNQDFEPEVLGQKSGSGFFDGKMSNFMMFRYVLSDAEIRELYNSGKGDDSLVAEERDEVVVNERSRARYR